MTVIATDVSYFQPVVNDSYPHDWFIFRACDGSFTDPHAAHNLAWSTAARASGKLINFTTYVVYRPGMNGTILGTLDQLRVPTDCVVMIDVESWGGEIRGDQSHEITALASALRARQSGRPDLVWAYANSYDFASVFPHRPAWLGLVVASYGSQRPAAPGPGPLVAWQYTGGTSDPVPTGWPTSSPPFGVCDHNVIYSTPTPGPENPLMADQLSPAVVKQLEAIIDARVRAQLNVFTRIASDPPVAPGHQIRTVVAEQLAATEQRLTALINSQTGKLAHSADFGLDGIAQAVEHPATPATPGASA